MTLGRLIEIADSAYGNDGAVKDFFENPYCDCPYSRDTLAEFIVRELKDTYNPDASDFEQLETAMRAMRSARDQLGGVIKAFAQFL